MEAQATAILSPRPHTPAEIVRGAVLFDIGIAHGETYTFNANV